jgi:predicted DNA-binding transcriptional regulator AlpA
MAARRFISYQQIVERGIFSNRVTLQRQVNKRVFPPPYKIGRRVLWDEAEVNECIESRRVNVPA